MEAGKNFHSWLEFLELIGASCALSCSCNFFFPFFPFYPSPFAFYPPTARYRIWTLNLTVRRTLKSPLLATGKYSWNCLFLLQLKNRYVCGCNKNTMDESRLATSSHEPFPILLLWDCFLFVFLLLLVYFSCLYGNKLIVNQIQWNVLLLMSQICAFCLLQQN